MSKFIPPPKRATVDAKEAAEYIGVSYWLLLEMAKRGEVPCIRAGRRVLFRVASLDAWMRDQEEKSVRKHETTGTGKIRRVL
ncbi:MAG: helix-turn-helix domain-containing protein [Firmicutes bacterium]|nr:helix-turn-helix domain-containing protein [Bacillota bacterium]